MNFNDHGVIVPDCSFWQDVDATSRKIDFAKMRDAGAVGVILRAGQNSWIDEDYADYVAACKAINFPFGSYWFYDSRNEPGRQANLWRQVIGSNTPPLGLWTDLEESYHGAYAGERNWKLFQLAIDAFFPQSRRGIYTANWWWTSQSVTDPAFWANYPLWAAQYTTNPADVTLPAPWRSRGCVFWQYTSSGNGPNYGVESANIDLNKWNGTLDSFRVFFGQSAPQPPTGEPMYYKVIATVLNIRNGAGVGYADIGDLLLGDIVETVEPLVNGWIHIKGVTRGGQPVVLPSAANSWCSGGNAYVVEYTPEPPAPSFPDTLWIGETRDSVREYRKA